MRRLTRTERRAALAVAGMAAAVTVSGVKLLKRHTDYVIKKAAALFDDRKEKMENGNSKND